MRELGEAESCGIRIEHCEVALDAITERFEGEIHAQRDFAFDSWFFEVSKC